MSFVRFLVVAVSVDVSVDVVVTVVVIVILSVIALAIVRVVGLVVGIAHFSFLAYGVEILSIPRCYLLLSVMNI